jgi:hypothetical protein
VNALTRASLKNGQIDANEFMKIFKKNQDTLNNYRRIISRETINEKSKISSSVGSDLYTLLRNAIYECDWVYDISEAVSELIDNACAHSVGDILIDIDICGANKFDDEREYKVINIALINLDDCLLFDKIKKNIEEQIYPIEDELYSRIYAAYDYHKTLFDKKYFIDDYFMVTAFQNHVTSRHIVSGKNGTGLTNLIEQIIETTEDDYSYVLSGSSILFFRKNCMKIKNGFIGFNEDGNYFTDRPSDGSLAKSEMYIPGTVYNLQLIKELD